MAIGAVNRFFIVPAVEHWGLHAPVAAATADPSQRFLRVLRIDTAVFLVIIVCAALLGMQTPPSHDGHGDEHGHHMGDATTAVRAADHV
jgi:putative copper export protein